MSVRKILIVDDEAAMRKLIRSFLVQEGYAVLEAANGLDALKAAASDQPDIMIVDVMMPYMDGFTFTEELRKTSNTPVIFLSAKGEEWDKVKGLRLGADDYLVKPFHSGELLARIESVLRRTDPNFRKEELLKAGPVSLDQTSHRAFIDEQELSLTVKEFKLLSLLMTNKNSVVTREYLMETVWGHDYSGTERTVDTHVKTLRMKMKQHGELIKTVWGLGYKLEV
ncbi:response regulator transcription factor [Jeotgalibacillus proteolyticus]|uniref:DNA-binding response regulator n=1 Tax=Jeotgalibacillus proteolyticus TaxID=2082395 RepID=A0A2S5GD24_9BACL|nr:response regulator transcription factor [Jeotgalibacillus proteolyticus]PPA70889.1 DNA-binding response regulator [Jeotgalibacillus proteolyticus]